MRWWGRRDTSARYSTSSIASLSSRRCSTFVSYKTRSPRRACLLPLSSFVREWMWEKRVACRRERGGERGTKTGSRFKEIFPSCFLFYQVARCATSAEAHFHRSAPAAWCNLCYLLCELMLIGHGGGQKFESRPVTSFLSAAAVAYFLRVSLHILVSSIIGIPWRSFFTEHYRSQLQIEDFSLKYKLIFINIRHVSLGFFVTELYLVMWNIFPDTNFTGLLFCLQYLTIFTDKNLLDRAQCVSTFNRTYGWPSANCVYSWQRTELYLIVAKKVLINRIQKRKIFWRKKKILLGL